MHCVQFIISALLCNVLGDNEGPPTSLNVIQTLNSIQNEFPNAIVAIDTFESFVNALLARPDIVNSLTVYTEEMGDIWYGFFDLFLFFFIYFFQNKGSMAHHRIH